MLLRATFYAMLATTVVGAPFFLNPLPAQESGEASSRNPLVVDARDWTPSEVYERVQQTRASLVVIIWGGNRELQQSAYNGALDLRDSGIRVIYAVGNAREDREIIPLGDDTISLSELRTQISNLSDRAKFEDGVQNYARNNGVSLSEARSEMTWYFQYLVSKRNIYFSTRDENHNPSIYIEMAGCGDTRTIAWDSLRPESARQLVRDAGSTLGSCLRP